MRLNLPTIEAELSALQKKLRAYQELSGKTWEEVLSKQGGKLGFLLFQRLRGLAPAKGQVRAERLAALRHGEGIRVRQNARDWATNRTISTASSLRTRRGIQFRERTKAGGLKRNGRSWWQIAVAREIAIRESGRGFVAVSGRYPRTLGREQAAVSRYGPELSRAGLIVTGQKGRAEFVWDPGTGHLAASAVHGLERPRGKAALALAVRDLSRDIDVYITRKTEERIGKAGLK